MASAAVILARLFNKYNTWALGILHITAEQRLQFNIAWNTGTASLFKVARGAQCRQAGMLALAAKRLCFACRILAIGGTGIVVGLATYGKALSLQRECACQAAHTWH